MKLLPFPFIILLFVSITGANDGITFTIEELSKPETLLAELDIEEIYVQILKKEYKQIGDLDKKDTEEIAESIIASGNIPPRLVNYGNHSFFRGMYHAYAEHRPFVLSPDMIWLLICQGFAQHLEMNADQLHKVFVNHDGKKTLVVTDPEGALEKADFDWEPIISTFTHQIAKTVGRDLIQLLSADFSTTGAAEKIATEITVLKAMNSYFEYTVTHFICGIPEVTLLGTTADWRKVLKKTKSLSQYDLDWWVSELEPLLEQFIKASAGTVDRAFWMNMFKRHKADKYATSNLFDGWIVRFFPYTKHERRSNLDSLFSAPDLPPEVVKVPFRYTMIHPLYTKEIEMELWAGFLGLEQDINNYALKPCIGWFIRKNDGQGEVDRKIRQNLAKMKTDDNTILSIRVDTIPEALYDMKIIHGLKIDFINNIDIPERLAKLRISILYLNGRISAAETKRIRKLFPNTFLVINGEQIPGS